MSIADDMRDAAINAQALVKLHAKQRLIAEHQEFDQLKREAKKHRSSLFSNVLVKIEEAASRGNTHYHYRYDNKIKKKQAEVSVIAEEASNHGFTVNYKTEVVDHGDSAAPCRIEEFWLDISWGPDLT